MTRQQYIPLVAVTFAVTLNIISAISLKSLADHGQVSLLLFALAIGFLTFINGLRFLIWGYAHKRFPLSKSYPLTSIFFPLMLIISYSYGDPVTLKQIAGTMLITIGVIWMTARVKS